jgi:crossover junction endodeoxyribonuclease RuvC
MRVIGIDPGLRHTGWGIVEARNGRIAHLANGVLDPEGDDLAGRLADLAGMLRAVILLHRPDRAAVEQTFVNKDAAGTLKLGQARGICLLIPAEAGLPVAEYAPNAVKKAVTGSGHAGKEQVEAMIRLQLPGAAIAGPDAADALAVALTHIHLAGHESRLAAALARAGAGAAR